MSNSLWPHGLQHTRLPCPSPSPGVWSNSCPLSRWWHPTISSSIVPFFSCLQSFPASGSFLMSQLFVSGGQSIGALASASVLPMNIRGWFSLGLTREIEIFVSLPNIFFWLGLLQLQYAEREEVFLPWLCVCCPAELESFCSFPLWRERVDAEVSLLICRSSTERTPFFSR